MFQGISSEKLLWYIHTMNIFNFSVSFVALALVVVSAQQQHDPNYCYATDPIRPQLARFSSRTAYETIRGPVINPGVSGEYLLTIGC